MDHIYPRDKLQEALADPGLVKLPKGPARELLSWIAVEATGGYTPVPRGDLVIRETNGEAS